MRLPAAKSLRIQLPVVVLAVFLAAGLLFVVVTRAIVVDGFSRLETEAVLKDVDRAEATLRVYVQRMSLVVGDWAPWDDTYLFMTGKLPSYPASNLTPDTMLNLGVDFLCYVRNDGTMQYAAALNPYTAERAIASPLMIERIQGLVMAKGDGAASGPIAGEILLPSGPAAVAIGKVTSSDRSKASPGYLVAGTYLHAAEQQELSTNTLLNVELVEPEAMSKALPSEGGAPRRMVDDTTIAMQHDTITAWTTQTGLDGRPAVTVVIKEPRDVMRHGMQTVQYGTVGVLGFIILFGVAAGVTVDSFVLRRLLRLHAAVAEIGSHEDCRQSVDVEGDDEIADLAHTINETVAELAETREALRHAADHDYLTGLANRRRFEHDAVRMFAEAERHETTCALVLVDIDHFKQVNDQFGHAAGDDILVWFSDVMRGIIRPYDSVCRLGGDEFALLLAETGALEARAFVERLRDEIDATPLPVSGQGGIVGFSYGIAVYPADGTDLDAVSLVADTALYDDKEHRHAR